MTNYQISKILRIERNSNYITFGFDKTVPHKDSGSGYSFISCVDSYPFNTYQIGDYLEIDLEMVKFIKHGGDDGFFRFSNTGIIRKVSSNEIVRGSNNTSITSSMNGNEITGIVQHINRAIDSDERNEYEARIHVDPNSGKFSGYSIIGRRK